ncbi:MAG: 3-phosphoshikimate 1-carboxyvinyltransferase [Bacteroidetes bacterium]|nr:MAG: 3-phosphoshikimate 1-carboxyvinyltransferase [Bacteroidota bacterium]
MIRLSHPTSVLKGSIKLPSSKSISNRMLILQNLYEQDMKLDNLSNANDTQLLQEIFKSESKNLNVQDAGTAFRFLTAYCAVTPGEWVIHGTDRLNERPISQLVDSLRLLGADISYVEEEGKAPLRIKGKQLTASDVLLDLTHVKTSQFISALLMIAPKIHGDFKVKVNTKMSSYAYVLLTIGCLRRMGYTVWVNGQYIKVSHQQKFDGEYFVVEPDWTSFYYWLSMAHLAKEVNLFFPGLRLDNMSKERKLLYHVGHSAMHFEERDNGLRLTKSKSGNYDIKEELNFSQFPDSAMTYAVLIPAIGAKKVKLKGLESLKYKECNREEAITSHLNKMGVNLSHSKEGVWQMDATGFKLEPETFFESYDDHRMAMCVAPLALLDEIIIENEAVVKKSYPHFWDDLGSVGFQVEQISLKD